jgi:hypothetical protein
LKVLLEYHKNDSFNVIMLMMQKLLLVTALCCVSIWCKAQQKLLSRPELVYLVNSSLKKAGEFMKAKGYKKIKAKQPGFLKYHVDLADSSASDVEIHANLERMYIYISTNEVQQVILFDAFILPGMYSVEESSGMADYNTKDVGDVNIKVTNSPDGMTKHYDIKIASNKNISTHN